MDAVAPGSPERRERPELDLGYVWSGVDVSDEESNERLKVAGLQCVCTGLAPRPGWKKRQTVQYASRSMLVICFQHRITQVVCLDCFVITARADKIRS